MRVSIRSDEKPPEALVQAARSYSWPGCTGFIEAVLAALGRAGSELCIDERLDEYDHVGVNASITKVITGRTGRHLLTFNDHAHLESDRSLITYR